MRRDRRLPRRAFQGFTLIELVVVIAIAAILATIAIPGYQRYVRNAERDFATTWLVEKNTELDRIRLRRGDFERSGGSVDLDAIGEALLGVSGKQFHLSRSTGATVAATTASRYRFNILEGDNPNRPMLQLSAINVQSKDETCTTLQILSNGSRRSLNKSGASTTADCWR